MSFRGRRTDWAVTLRGMASDAVFAANGIGGATRSMWRSSQCPGKGNHPTLSFGSASVPVAAQTAWQGNSSPISPGKGQTILIHGGAGAVGAYAVQWHRMQGPTVIAKASGGMRRTQIHRAAGSSIIERRSSRGSAREGRRGLD